MRKIDLQDYATGEGPFLVRSSLVSILFNEEGLNPRELLRRDELAQRIETWPDDVLLVEQADHSKLVGGLNATDLKPFGRSVVEFVRRVVDAPDVDVREKTSDA